MTDRKREFRPLPWEITREMFLSEREVEKLLRHVRRSQAEDRVSADLDRLIIECLLYSGLRTSEICRLSVDDSPAGKARRCFRVRSPGGSGRIVYLPSKLCALIRDFARKVRPELLPSSVRPGDGGRPLLFSERRQPYHRTGLYRRVRRVLSEVDMGERASVQLLRHTYGYLAYKQTGGNLLFVQRQLGHAHPMITSVYARLVDESYEDLAERVFRTSVR